MVVALALIPALILGLGRWPTLSARGLPATDLVITLAADGIDLAPLGIVDTMRVVINGTQVDRARAEAASLFDAAPDHAYLVEAHLRATPLHQAYIGPAYVVIDPTGTSVVLIGALDGTLIYGQSHIGN